MTNLEYYVSKGLIKEGCALCYTAHICKYGGKCHDKECYECEFSNNIDLCVQTLLQEHREPIKLKQWEYDFLDYLIFLGCGAIRFECYYATKYFFYTKGQGVEQDASSVMMQQNIFSIQKDILKVFMIHL